MVKMLLKALGKVLLYGSVGAGVSAYLTKPTDISLGVKIAKNIDELRTRIEVTHSVNQITVFEDYVFFKLAKIEYGGQRCKAVGAFNEWYVYE
jgi:hypothetical protein